MGAPIFVGLVVLVYLPLVGGDRIVTGRGNVVVVGPVQLYYGSGPSPSRREVRDIRIWFDLNSYKENVVDTPIQFTDVTIHNLSQGPVHVASHDTFGGGFVGLHTFGGPLIGELELRSEEMCFAQLGVVFTREEWRALRPGFYPFEVTIVAEPAKDSGGVQSGDKSGGVMPCSPSGVDRGN